TESPVDAIPTPLVGWLPVHGTTGRTIDKGVKMVEAFAQRGLSRRRAVKLLGGAGAGLAATRLGLTSGAATAGPGIGSPEWRAPAVIARQQTVNLQWFMWSGSPA